MKKFLLGMALGALVMSAIRLQVVLSSAPEPEADDELDGLPPEVQSLVRDVRSQLGPDAVVKVRQLHGAEAQAALREVLPHVAEALARRGSFGDRVRRSPVPEREPHDAEA